jgi:hypothetical protein
VQSSSPDCRHETEPEALPFGRPDNQQLVYPVSRAACCGASVEMRDDLRPIAPRRSGEQNLLMVSVALCVRVTNRTVTSNKPTITTQKHSNTTQNNSKQQIRPISQSAIACPEGKSRLSGGGTLQRKPSFGNFMFEPVVIILSWMNPANHRCGNHCLSHSHHLDVPMHHWSHAPESGQSFGIGVIKNTFKCCKASGC